jgi:Ser-tRNA(Ala) deacylase AlaX
MSACPPPTDMIYMTFEGNFERGCQASVLNVETMDSKVAVVLDQTVLHAQGGGQPSDVGEIASSGASLTVEKVTIDRETGVATHTGEYKQSTGLSVGDSVQVTVDWDLRTILSECHTAGHVVDSAMAHCGLMWRPSKAYHFLDGPYVEYIGEVPPNDRDSVLTRLQESFQELVCNDIETQIDLVSMQEADAMCNRIANNFDMKVFADPRTRQIRVVTVAGYSCPCGGTHVRRTGDLKTNGWQITGLKAKKGVVRVKYGQKK